MGGTFTITSIGNIGGLFATPIIHHPQVGILGIGKNEILAAVGIGMEACQFVIQRFGRHRIRSTRTRVLLLFDTCPGRVRITRQNKEPV